MIRTKRTLSLARAIAGLIAMFSISSLATETNSTTNAKIGEHFRVVPAADGINEVTIVGNGLNYQDTNGAWIASVPVVQSFPNAIVCTGASYRVILATNLNSLGSVDLELPADSAATNRGRMVSHPLGLAFYDPDSGATVLLAPLQDCSAQVVSNQVIFTDAFVHTNGIQGAVTYTYDVGHFHQDVTLTTKPTVTPADFGMGPNARLEMLTQFEQSPEPEITESTVSAGTSARTSAMLAQTEPESPATDQTLNYGTMRMGRGRAFATAAASPLNSLTVTKQLISVANQNFLTEDVPWAKAAETLQNLPEATDGTNAQASARHTVPRELMIAQLSTRGSKPIAKAVQSFKERLADVQRSAPLQVAAIKAMPSGFVLDYELVESCDDYTFQSGHTYLISTYTQIGYLTIESNAVIKFSGGNLQPMWALNCPDNEPKAVLTDMNDDSVGEVISGSAGHFTTYHAYAALEMSGLDGYGSYTHNLDIRFVSVGISAPTIEGNWCYIYDSTFFKCGQGIYGSPDFAGLSSCDFCEVDTPYPSEFSDLYGITYCSTSVDRNGNGLPDDWEFNWFGSFGHSGSELDSQGNTLLYDCQHNLDPNVIQFTIEADNDYARTTNASLTLKITGGTPFYYAAVVNNGATNWHTFTTTNLLVSLGATDGVYSLSVGLRGLPAGAAQTWQDYEFTLDRVAPIVTITNPALVSGSATVVKPYLQLQGFANEQLASLSYDISNVFGLVTNLDAFVTDQAFDTNAFDFTTNYFQAYDVELATNVNRITLRATDLAGNTTTTNVAVTLDYSGAAVPAITLTWPTNGMELCGSSFTLRGLVDDEAATVFAAIASDNQTNIIAGEVERSGVLWVENLPLNSGTNWLTLMVTNSAGLASSTNIYIVHNDMTLTVTSIDGDLWAPSVTVHGAVSEPSYCIWVNGVKGTNYGDGTWTVDNVPVSAGGVATFDVNAIPPGGGDPSISYEVEKEAKIIMVNYEGTGSEDYSDSSGTTHHDRTVRLEKDSKDDKRSNHDFFSQSWTGGSTSWTKTDYKWSGDLPMSVDYHRTDLYAGESSGTITEWEPVDYYYTVGIPMEDQTWGCATCGSSYQYEMMNHFYAKNVRWRTNSSSGWTLEAKVNARTEMKLYTGGKEKSKRKSLFQITAYAERFGQPPLDFGRDYPWWNTPSTPVEPTKINVLGWWLFGHPLDYNGYLYRALPDNAEINLNLRVPGVKHYDAHSSQQKFKLVHETVHPALTDTNLDRLNLGVGEEVNFRFEPTTGLVSPDIDWTTTGGSSGTQGGDAMTFTAPSNAANVTVTVKVKGETLKEKFKVLEPSDETAVKNGPDDPPFTPPTYGAGMHLSITVNPTYVSFYRVQFTELAGPASNIHGVFTNVPPSNIYHWPALTVGVTNNWVQLNTFNGCADHAQFSITGNPMYSGGFDIDIPMRWRIDTGSDEHLFPNRLQSCEITGSGSAISAAISKLMKSAHQP